MNCLIVHGLEGHDEENWFPWLAEQLNEAGIETKIPNFPNSDEPKLSEWMNYLEDYKIDEDTILIGHSLGSVLILRLLERGVSIKASFLTAVFIRDLGWEVLKESNFFKEDFDWKEIRNNAEHFEVLTSKNDPYLDVEDGGEVAEKLKVENQVLDVHKHFNMDEFPLLLNKVKKVT